MIEKVSEAVNFLKEKGFDNPEYGIILGTGLGALAEEIQVEQEFVYTNIPHFPIATVEFHKGKLIYGTLEGKKIVAMQGRFHYYEGHSMGQVVFPVRVMHQLGIKNLIISNAGGCMNLDWKKGDLMLIVDHINLQPDNPLRGREAAAFGQIFTDMSNPYDGEMNDKLLSIASNNNIKLNKGVYVSVEGPSLETKAEYRFLRMIGADVVGMSTVPEVIAANQMNLPVSAVSVLTDECDPDNLKPVDIEDIIATAKAAEKDLVVLIRNLIKEL
ncbi:purine-nucleoside phosphorylase [Ekhidna sp. To15]|uniref:purine-nucleoside phosphorylase n=1 Tax=Ekhidna sp. To15 TaxID=3395267 RepID=UPI003F5221EF